MAKLVWTWNDSEGHDACAELAGHETVLTMKAGAKLVMQASGGRVSLDRISLRWVKAPAFPAPPPAPVK